MRVGILTFHNAHNYGAVLQAYALKTYINLLGYEADIINYRNPAIQKVYQRKLTWGLQWRDFRNWNIIKNKFKFLLEIKYMQASWERQCIAFEKFISTYLTNTPVVPLSEIQKGIWDILCVGSDQVWTSSLTGGLDKVYLLDFLTTGKKKISYAGSIAGGKIPQEEWEIFSRCLAEFDCLSAREQSLSESITACCHKKVETVLDPTLLLDASAYRGLIEEAKRPEGKYVFCYYVIESDELRKCALKIAKMFGAKLIELHYYMRKGFDSNSQFADYSPSEFLKAIYNAEFVLTNSFHGTVFSILFQKLFYSVYDKNARIQNLLDTLGTSVCHIKNADEVQEQVFINYMEVKERLEEMRQRSYRYLERALEPK